MGRKRAYIRVWKDGPTADEQRAALHNAGFDLDEKYAPIYIDAPSHSAMRHGAVVLEQREACIAAMRGRPQGEEPDELMVCAPWVLALSPGDLFAVAAKLAEKGAVIHDLTSGKKMLWTPEMAGMAAMAASVAKFQGKRKAEKMRLSRALSDEKPGPKPKLSGRLLELFLADWADEKAGTNLEVAERHGIKLGAAKRLAGMSRSEAIRRELRRRHDAMEEPVVRRRRGRSAKAASSTSTER